MTTLPAIVSQASRMVRYLNTTYGSSPTLYDNIKSLIEDMREDFMHAIDWTDDDNDPGVVNEIKSLAVGALVQLWYGQDVCGRYGMGGGEQTSPKIP